MSLDNVPLALRIDNDHYTLYASDLEFQDAAVGGIQYLTFTLSKPLPVTCPEMASVKVYDTRSGETVAEGRLADTGHTVSTTDGNVYLMNAFGPAQHASDISNAFIYVDDTVDDGWVAMDNTRTGTTEFGSMQPNTTDEGSPVGILVGFPQGTTLVTNDRRGARYERLYDAGMKLARFSCTVDSGNPNSVYSTEFLTRLNGSSTGETAYTGTASTTGTVHTIVVVTNFPSGRNTVDVRLRYTGAGTTTGNDNGWTQFYNTNIRSMLMTASGTDITTGYTNGYVLAHEVINDLLGRALPQFDGAGASVDTSGTFQISKLAYPDPVTPAQILDDLMLLEPAFRWYTGPDTTGNGYSFSWVPWPTSVRYQATLQDGGAFPVSMQDLYNKVVVRYVPPKGRQTVVTRTAACPILDAAGITRQAYLDLGTELGNAANAAEAGDNFLAEHKLPPNSGTVTISRPVWDVVEGRWVQPFEIAAGELIRLVGPDVDAYPDALNASSNDGQSVFRIWTKTYNSGTNAATLELDTYSRTTANALTTLAGRRKRA